MCDHTGHGNTHTRTGAGYHNALRTRQAKVPDILKHYEQGVPLPVRRAREPQTADRKIFSR